MSVFIFSRKSLMKYDWMLYEMIDVEIKAICHNPDKISEVLLSKGATFLGTDFQKDIYFKVNNGRLKLRLGNIEKALVFYQRENSKGIKPSEFFLYQSNDPESLLFLLKQSCGILVEVNKKRQIFLIENIKFNLDEVENLGNFVEIEAMTNNVMEIDSLRKKVASFITLFGIHHRDLQSLSYSDLLLDKQQKHNVEN